MGPDFHVDSVCGIFHRPPLFLVLAREIPGIDLEWLRRDMEGETAKAARHPVPEARDTKETEGRLRYSFPALLLRNAAGAYRILDGDHVYPDYLAAIRELAPGAKRGSPPDVETFVRRYRRVATKEISVVCEFSWEEAEAALEKLVDTSKVRKRPVGHFCLWEWTAAGPR